MLTPGILNPNESQTVRLQVIFSVGMTPGDNPQIGVYWPEGPMQKWLNNLSAPNKQRVVDAIITAVKNSLDQRVPRIIEAH